MDEAVKALYGTLRLAALDRGGLAFFARSEAAFWRSFRAALLCYPAFLILRALAMPDVEFQSANWPRIFLAETIAYVIGWTAYPLASLPLARVFRREEAWLGFIIVYNWSQILEYGALLATTGVAGSGLLPPGITSLPILAVSLAILVYGWFVARATLDISALQAVAFVALDQLLAIAIEQTAVALH